MDASNLLKPAWRAENSIASAPPRSMNIRTCGKRCSARPPVPAGVRNEPSVEDTISILRGIKEKYELHHGVRITYSALVAAARLSHRYITDRFLPDKAIDLMDEAGARLRMQVDSKPEALDELDRRIIQLKIEREALKKENDRASKERLDRLEKELGELEERATTLTQAWQAEKEKLAGLRKLQEDLDQARIELEQVQRRGDLARAGELAYGVIPSSNGRSRIWKRGRPAADGRGGGYRTACGAGRVALDRHPGRPDARRRAREASEDGRSAEQARRRPGRSRQGGLDRGQAGTGRASGSQQADRLLHVSGADRRRQDRA